MALQLPWDAYGVTFPAAYARVELTKVRRAGNAYAKITIYSDATQQHEIGTRSVDFALDKGGDNIHTQAYTAAKLLPELAGAVDV